MLEMSVVHGPPQMWWQGVPHPRAGCRKRVLGHFLMYAANSSRAERDDNRASLCFIRTLINHTSKALGYGMRSQGISQFYLHTPHTCANGMNHTCLCLLSRSWYSFIDPGGMEGW